MVGTPQGTFWKMTPWQLSIAQEAFWDVEMSRRDHTAWCMWHGAVIPMMKKPPPLATFLSTAPKNTPKPKGDFLSLKEHLIAYQKRKDKLNGKNITP